MFSEATPWGPSGQTVYERTYSRTKKDGVKERWEETCRRVADGNMAFVAGSDRTRWTAEQVVEAEDVFRHLLDFRLLPGGRHLWATGATGAEFVSNCFLAPTDVLLSRHISFLFERLMEGGGVGSNYSHGMNFHRDQFHWGGYDLHFVCDPTHQDYDKLVKAGIISADYHYGYMHAVEVHDSREGWAAAAAMICDDITDAWAASGEKVTLVLDLSSVRPEGSEIKTFGGKASGPTTLAVSLVKMCDILNNPRWRSDGMMSKVQLMEIDHALSECVISGGVRRSARMSMLRWDDEEIFDFIHCKEGADAQYTTNISVIIDDAFQDALRNDDDHAHDVLDELLKGMHRNGEPGWFHIDNANRDGKRTVVGTNPCGEVILEEGEACVIGHVNIAAFNSLSGPECLHAHTLMTRFLLRATEAQQPDELTAKIVAKNRRIGVGHVGVQTYLTRKGLRFDDDNAIAAQLSLAKDVVDRAALQYATQLGIPVPVATTTMAPTGTVAKLPGVSEGIAPIPYLHYERRIRFNILDSDQVKRLAELEAEGYEIETCQYDKTGKTKIVVQPSRASILEIDWNGVAESGADMPPEQLLRVQSMYQQFYVDNAISVTVNFNPDRYSVDQLRDSILPFIDELKGITVYPDKSRPQSPYTPITRGEYEKALARVTGDGVDGECKGNSCPVK